jgi:hypothetical protein
MATDQNFDPSAFGVQDPTELQSQQDEQYNTLAAKLPYAQASRLMNAKPMTGMDPGIAQQAQLQQRLKDILAESNASAPADEDPLDAQLRTANAVGKGMLTVNPQVGMQALQMAAKAQQAKGQQAKLQAETSNFTEEAAARKRTNAINAATGTIIFAKQGAKDENGLPGMLEAVGTVDPSDPDFAAKAMQIKNDAAKNGDTVVPMTGDQFLNGKAQMAAVRGQYALAAANQRAMVALQTAQLRLAAKGQQFGGLAAQGAMRMLGSANAASQAIQNIAEMPIGSSTGWLGTDFGAHAGTGLSATLSGNLRNQLSSQDIQSYTNATTGLSRSLATLEAQGSAQGLVGLTASLEGQIRIRPGDTALTAVQRLAEMRQIVEKNVELTLKRPDIPDEIKAQMQEALGQLAEKVPWTVHDVTAFRAASDKNPRLTFTQWAQKQGVSAPGASPAAPAAPAATAAPSGWGKAERG